MKAAIYARYSTDLQDKTSISGQFANAEALCKKHGFEIACRFSDEAISGTDDTRPGYRALIAAAERGDVDAIVVDETSRLTRNPSTLLALLDTLAYREQALLDCRGFDSRQQSAPLLAGLHAGMDRMELEKIKARTHRGLSERAKAGHWTGGKTYGYRTVPVDANDPQSKRRLVIEPAEAAIILDVFTMYADGASPKRIASELNERGIASPGSAWKRTKRRTKGWMHTALVGTAARGTGMLRNELYAGKLVWNKRRSKKVPGTSRRMFSMRPKGEWVTVDAPELRIVPADVWQRVQRRLDANRERAKDRKTTHKGYHVSRYLLSGLLQCGVCGSNFIMSNAVAYSCSSHTNGGKHCCSNDGRVRRDVVEPIVLRGLKQDLLSDEAIAEVRRIVADAQRGKKSQSTNVERDIRDVGAAIERVTDAIAEAGISRALREKLRALESQRDDLEARLRSSTVDAGAVDLLPRLVDRWRGLVDGLEDLATRPAARPSDVEEARERLSKMISVRLVPEAQQLVAEVRLAGLDDELYIPMVAGVGFEPTTFGL